MDYAIIRVGGKQHRVRDGETLVVDRVRTDEGGTFEPDVLLGDDGVKVTVTVLAHERGPEDPDRQVPQAHRLQAPQRLPRGDLADRDLARRQAARRRESGEGRRSEAAPEAEAAPAVEAARRPGCRRATPR